MKSIQETMSGLSDASAFETFDRMAEQIDQMEAEAEAGAEVAEQYSGDILKHRFSELEASAGADDELDALKRKMGLVPAERPAATARVATPDGQYEEEDLAELEEALEELKRRER
jgi:phage shock protein A